MIEPIPDKALESASRLLSEGKVDEAAEVFKQLTANKKYREPALVTLTQLYTQTGQADNAIAALIVLNDEHPYNFLYCTRLAILLEDVGDLDGAIQRYERLLQHQPQLATAHYNLALLYKKTKRFVEAERAYEQALRAGIDHAEEVYSNMGVMFSEIHQADKAQDFYERALQVDETYIPAIFNLAGLLEERGDLEKSTELYNKILSLDPKYWDALARLVHSRRITAEDTGVVDGVRNAIPSADDPLAKETLWFALGKAMDDLGRYADAFNAYSEANALGKSRNAPYSRDKIEAVFQHYKSWFSAERVNGLQTHIDERPVFICGMFRSGTTLVEQILARHPAVSAGGELDFLGWLAARHLYPFPEQLMNLNSGQVEDIGNQYLKLARSLYPKSAYLTDKCPINFIYIGLIKILFPRARIIYTRRNALDNCLSIYFQQLGEGLNYATDLDDTAHYYLQHLDLMEHWLANFGSDIFTISYELLVQSPDPVVRSLLQFLDLDWNDRCLDFRRTDNLVKTASIWQVREELYRDSMERWRNYEPYLKGLKSRLKELAS